MDLTGTTHKSLSLFSLEVLSIFDIKSMVLPPHTEAGGENNYCQI